MLYDMPYDANDVDDVDCDVFQICLLPQDSNRMRRIQASKASCFAREKILHE